MEKSEARNRIHELVDLLNKASRAYYANDEEIMSNYEYDKLYDELEALENETGIVLSSSPTRNVGYEAVLELPKERHEQPMLSLGKTKSVDELQSWITGQRGLLSWKLDGLTVVLTYRDGELIKAVTRGNGEIGEVITANAHAFKNIPMTIPYKGEMILRGEAVIRYSDFEKINRKIEEAAARDGVEGDVRYKNPRNLCSGSVRQLDSKVTADRDVRFYAFALVSAPGVDFDNSRKKQYEFLREQGFEVVDYLEVEAENIREAVSDFERRIQTYDIPSDGLVLLLDDIAYGESLGRTAKFPRNAIAFKWADEVQETTLLEVEWSASRTGLINPVAIFEPVELEGTTVKRASVHNVSIVRQLKLGLGDRITVYKANMIIPQIAENLTGSGTLEIPAVCPVCGGATEIRNENETETLFCTNSACPAKKIKAFSLFVSRGAMNIEGLSEMTLEKFISAGFIHSFSDIYHLRDFKEQITSMEGFGEKSYEKLEQGIEKSRNTTLPRLVFALGIPGIGAANARVLCDYYHHDLELLEKASAEELAEVEGIGMVLANSIHDYFADPGNVEETARILRELTLEKPAQDDPNAQKLAGKTFVITGKVHHFANRDELKAAIISRGGKAAGSVSAKTDYLINNDVSSNSSKNKKARELGIPILSEEDFLEMIQN